MRKNTHRIQSSRSEPVFAPEYSNIGPFRKKFDLGRFGGRNLGSKSVGWENLVLDHFLRSKQPQISISDALSGLKCSENWIEAIEILGRSYGQK